MHSCTSTFEYEINDVKIETMLDAISGNATLATLKTGERLYVLTGEPSSSEAKCCRTNLGTVVLNSPILKDEV